jgi:hypothetical protein
MFLEILHWYFKGRLEELSTIMAGELNGDSESQEKDDMDLDEKSKLAYRTGEMDIDVCYHQVRFSENNKLVKNIGKVVRDLRNLGFTSMTEDAYASVIFLLLKVSMCSILVIHVQLIFVHLRIVSFTSFFLPNILLYSLFSSICSLFFFFFFLYVTHLWVSSKYSCMHDRLKYIIWLVMITGVLFWSPLNDGYRLYCCLCVTLSPRPRQSNY